MVLHGPKLANAKRDLGTPTQSASRQSDSRKSRQCQLPATSVSEREGSTYFASQLAYEATLGRVVDDGCRPLRSIRRKAGLIRALRLTGAEDATDDPTKRCARSKVYAC